MRVRAHAAVAFGCERAQLRQEPAVLVEELLRLVALHPVLEHLDVPGLLRHLGHRDLVRAPVVLGLLAVDLLRAGPALRGLHDDHRPRRALGVAVLARVLLDPLDVGDRGVHRPGHLLVDVGGVGALDPVRLVAVADEQALQLLARDARHDGRVGDLVAVQMEDRQDRTVRRGVQELVRVPRRRQRPRLCLAVADDAGDDQVGVVEGRAIGMGDRVAELAALVDGAGGLGRGMAGDAAREGELLEEDADALLVLGDVGIELGVRPLEVRVRDHAGAAVPGAADVDHVEVVRLDDAIQVHVDEVQSRSRPPVAEQARLDVLDRQRLPEHRVVHQIDLAHRQIVGGAPVLVHQLQLLRREDLGGFGCGSGHRAPSFGCGRRDYVALCPTGKVV